MKQLAKIISSRTETSERFGFRSSEAGQFLQRETNDAMAIEWQQIPIIGDPDRLCIGGESAAGQRESQRKLTNGLYW